MPTAAKATVVEALSAVMGAVQAVGKGDRNQQQGYAFRGVDAVVNAVGPALREHGVVVVPTSVDWHAEHYKTAKGSHMRGVTVTIGFRFYGPAGDHIDTVAAGEASDAGDKAMPKAHSVAYRTLLLQALCIPTDDPDPDSQSHERSGEEPTAEPHPPGNGRGARGGPQREAPSSPVISQAQVGRLWTIARNRDLPDDDIRAIIVEHAGVESSREIPRARYDDVIAALEAWKATP